ncbi:MAG: monoterpene epsilon-lactone hydrolase [Arenicella sp.]|jgi:monoterpene epsilon-lactone hydrolase
MTWTIFITLALLWWLIATFILAGPDLSRYDSHVGETFDAHPEDAASTEKFLQIIKGVRNDTQKTKSLKKGFALVRKFADQLSDDLQTDTAFSSVTANGVSCEWAVAPGVDTARRVVFLHGGAFLFGSPKGHRKFSDQLSKMANAAVLSVDYRMLPEHSRMKSIIDSQQAYHWVLKNGPEGPQLCDFLIVAGDSAGGNLALMLSSWSKRGAAKRPDGVIGFSPSTDMTMSSPTIKRNRDTDKLLGEGLGLLTKLPKALRMWVGLFSMRINPSNKLASPLFDDLSDLPPTLLHASSSEMLLGEGMRYTNKAVAAGSPVRLQVWKNQIHDWHLFNMHTGSAKEAWGEIKKFIDRL